MPASGLPLRVPARLQAELARCLGSADELGFGVGFSGHVDLRFDGMIKSTRIMAPGGPGAKGIFRMEA